MYLEWVASSDTAKLESWDEFILSSPRGHYGQLSTWLNSFRVYGFETSLLIARERSAGPIRGGMGLLCFGNRGFGIVSSPVGPILDTGFEYAFKPILEAVFEHARRRRAFLLQLEFPCSTEVAMPALLPAVDLPEHLQPLAGLVFIAGNVPTEMLWLEFPKNLEGDAFRQHMFQRFKKNTRRDIRIAERHGVETFEATTEVEIQQAYGLIQRHGQMRGYATRTWKDFGPALIEQVRKRQAVILVARQGERLLGVNYSVLAGRRYSYVYGGVIRTEPDMCVGSFLHWMAISKAYELGMLGYDFTSGGPEGIRRHKMGFSPDHIKLVLPQHYILSNWRYLAFRRIYPLLRKYRQTGSTVLSVANRLLKQRAASR